MVKIIPLKTKETAKVKAYNEAYRKGTLSQVVYKHPKGWAIKRYSSVHPSNIFPQQKEAIQHAEELARKAGVSVVIQNANGSIKRVERF